MCHNFSIIQLENVSVRGIKSTTRPIRPPWRRFRPRNHRVKSQLATTSTTTTTMLVARKILRKKQFFGMEIYNYKKLSQGIRDHFFIRVYRVYRRSIKHHVFHMQTLDTSSSINPTTTTHPTNDFIFKTHQRTQYCIKMEYLNPSRWSFLEKYSAKLPMSNSEMTERPILFASYYDVKSNI